MRVTLLFTLVLFLGSCSIFAQKVNDEDEVKKTLLEIFEVCKSKDANKLAKHIVYRGNDASRKWKDISNPKNEDELMRVKSIMSRINKRYQPYEYKFDKFVTDTESEGKWNVWQLEFIIDGNAKIVSFAFLKIDGEFVLGDID